MNELVKIENDKIVTTSRQIAEVFEKQHGHVIRDIENISKDVSNFGEMFYETTMADSYGREQKVYMINRDGFSLLAMGFTGKKSLNWKLKYINAFNEMEKAWNTPEQVMARALRVADETINNLKLEVKEMQPKAIFADAVATSKTDILVGDLAKILKGNGVDIGQNRLFEWLRNHDYLNSRGDAYNMPSQKSMNLGLFTVKESTIVNADGSVRINKTTKVTGKGQQYFVNKFLAH